MRSGLSTTGEPDLFLSRFHKFFPLLSQSSSELRSGKMGPKFILLTAIVALVLVGGGEGDPRRGRGRRPQIRKVIKIIFNFFTIMKND